MRLRLRHQLEQIDARGRSGQPRRAGPLSHADGLLFSVTRSRPSQVQARFARGSPPISCVAWRVAPVFIRFRSWLTFDAGPSVECLRQRFVALDLETTGLDPRRDTIVSLAAIPFVGGAAVQGYVTLVDPGRAIPPQSTVIHGLTDAMVRGAPPLDRVLREVEPVFADAVLVGHNVGFDVAVLTRGRRAVGSRPCAIPHSTRRVSPPDCIRNGGTSASSASPSAWASKWWPAIPPLATL